MTTLVEQNVDTMPAGRELDALVAERAMGWKLVECQPSGRWFWTDGQARPPGGWFKQWPRECAPQSWSPSMNIVAAMRALLTMAGKKHWSYNLYNGDKTGAEPLAWCEIRLGNHTVIAEGTGGNPIPPDDDFDTDDATVAMCLAICRACLKAVPVREQWERDCAVMRAKVKAAAKV